MLILDGTFKKNDEVLKTVEARREPMNTLRNRQKIAVRTCVASTVAS